jgi:aspartokinase-like uncharacterized kinase
VKYRDDFNNNCIHDRLRILMQKVAKFLEKRTFKKRSAVSIIKCVTVPTTYFKHETPPENSWRVTHVRIHVLNVQ